MRVLVIGCGSIGERHIRNLQGLSAGEIIAHDMDRKRLSTIGERYKVQTCANLGQALKQKVDAVLVCTPPSTHVPIALKAIDRGAHVFIEKPISHILVGVDKLIGGAKMRNLTLSIGYNLRFYPALKLMKKMLDRGEIGKVLSARAELGQYLPDWRPWQDYRQSYTARKKLGGGIILDASHELDYLRWFLGEVREVFCFADKLSNLEVNTEDTAAILLRFKGSTIGEIHLDFVRRDYSRNCELIGENGSIVWAHPERVVRVYSTKNKKWRVFGVRGDLNRMYVEEMKHFIKCVLGKEKPLINGKEGKKTLEVALAAKKSAKIGKIVKL